jgi:hypothetical protein
MPRKKVWILSNQLNLFTEEEMRETCPLCHVTGDLVSCCRLFTVRRMCVRCAKELTAYGWKRTSED